MKMPRTKNMKTCSKNNETRALMALELWGSTGVGAAIFRGLVDTSSSETSSCSSAIDDAVTLSCIAVTLSCIDFSYIHDLVICLRNITRYCCMQTSYSTAGSSAMRLERRASPLIPEELSSRRFFELFPRFRALPIGTSSDDLTLVNPMSYHDGSYISFKLHTFIRLPPKIVYSSQCYALGSAHSLCFPSCFTQYIKLIEMFSYMHIAKKSFFVCV